MKLRMLLGIAALTLAACLAALPGCYTVLKHPAQVSMTDDHGGRRSCADCHDQSHYYHDPYMYRYYDRYSYADRWYGYYYDPWWYDDYWYYDSWDGEGPALQTGGRTRWGNEPERATPPARVRRPPSPRPATRGARAPRPARSTRTSAHAGAANRPGPHLRRRAVSPRSQETPRNRRRKPTIQRNRPPRRGSVR